MQLWMCVCCLLSSSLRRARSCTVPVLQRCVARLNSSVGRLPDVFSRLPLREHFFFSFSIFSFFFFLSIFFPNFFFFPSSSSFLCSEPRGLPTCADRVRWSRSREFEAKREHKVRGCFLLHGGPCPVDTIPCLVYPVLARRRKKEKRKKKKEKRKKKSCLCRYCHFEGFFFLICQARAGNATCSRREQARGIAATETRRRNARTDKDRQPRSHERGSSSGRSRRRRGSRAAAEASNLSRSLKQQTARPERERRSACHPTRLALPRRVLPVPAGALALLPLDPPLHSAKLASPRPRPPTPPFPSAHPTPVKRPSQPCPRPLLPPLLLLSSPPPPSSSLPPFSTSLIYYFLPRPPSLLLPFSPPPTFLPPPALLSARNIYPSSHFRPFENRVCISLSRSRFDTRSSHKKNKPPPPPIWNRRPQLGEAR